MAEYEIDKVWTDFKAIVITLKNLVLQYVENDNLYSIWANENGTIYKTQIFKNVDWLSSPPSWDWQADKTDFETNYKAHSNLPISPRTSAGVPKYSFEFKEGNRITKISHDFCDKTTWWQNAVKVLGEILTDSGDHTTYEFANDSIIDGGEISDRDFIYKNNLLDIKQKIGVRIYFNKVYVNDVLKTPVMDYSMNCSDGTVTFVSALEPSDIVKADYYYATTATFRVVPPSGKKWRLYRTEIQFSKDVIMKSFTFQIRLMNGAMVYDESSYFNIKDMLNHCNLCYHIPACAGLTKDVIILPWDYESTIDLKSSLGMDLVVDVEDNLPVTNCEIATITFYMFEEND